MVGASLAGRTQRSHWVRDAQLKAGAELLRGYTRVFLDLGRFCRHGIKTTMDTWNDWEQVLAGVSLVCSREVVDAALKLDEAIWRAHIEIKRGRRGESTWLEVRAPVEAARTSFVNVARERLIPRPGRTLSDVRGRPANDDPIWRQLEESRTPVVQGNATVEPRDM